MPVLNEHKRDLKKNKPVDDVKNKLTDSANYL